jgi:hypothetical protein
VSLWKNPKNPETIIHEKNVGLEKSEKSMDRPAIRETEATPRVRPPPFTHQTRQASRKSTCEKNTLDFNGF